MKVRTGTRAVTDRTSTDNQHFVEINDLNFGRSCRHPIDAVRWDEHRALLCCTSCGRKIEDGAQRSRRPIQAP